MCYKYLRGGKMDLIIKYQLLRYFYVQFPVVITSRNSTGAIKKCWFLCIRTWMTV